MKHVAHHVVVLLAVITSLHDEAFAWVYPEHREIALAALGNLDPERRRVFDSIWAAARGNQQTRLCEAPDDTEQGERPRCIDYAAWPAIAGDHSCSSQQMTQIVLTSDWILEVAAASARLERGLEKARGRDDMVNALRNSDIELQRADLEYATRAGANNIHFLLARPSFATTAFGYATAALTEGVEISALAAYSWYHIEALEKARSLSTPGLSANERAVLSLAVLADEAFALHFLQDAFAAGHVAGTWGNASLRKGTHDYYNERGLEVTTWTGERAILTGDAWMRPEDAERVARSVSKSLGQIIDAARGVGLAASFRVASPPSRAPGAFDSCRATTVPPREHDTQALLADVLMDTPRPMLAAGLGEMPRFRAELGPFAGIQSAARTSTSSGGFGESQTSPGASAGLELAFRLGVGLEGVLHEGGDGLVFLDLGVRLDGSSSNRFGDAPTLADAGEITAAIPGRMGYVARLRIPFWLVPMDLLVAGPVLLLASPSTLTKMAVVAGNGGVIPWQAGIATPIGRFQFILGREVGLGVFGYGENGDRFVVAEEEGEEERYTLIDLSSILLELPILEYRPFRSFSTNQSSTLLFQLYAAFDFPSRLSVITPVDNPEPDLKPVGYLGLRMSFDWRHYW